MKVYVVMSGWDNEDASPRLREVFADRDDAVKLIDKEFEEEYLRKVELWSNQPHTVRKKVSDNRWALEVNMLPSGRDWWQEGDMWTIEEREVL